MCQVIIRKLTLVDEVFSVCPDLETHPGTHCKKESRHALRKGKNMKTPAPLEKIYARWQIRLAIRRLAHPDDAVRARALERLRASGTECWPQLRRVAYRQRSALAVVAAETLCHFGDTQGLYALLELYADGTMHLWYGYGPRLRAQLQQIGPERIRGVLEFALDRIERQPTGRYCWSLSLAVYALYALKSLQAHVPDALWQRALMAQTPTLFEDLRECRAILPAITTEEAFSTPRTTWGVGRTVAAVRVMAIDALLTLDRPRALGLLAAALQSDMPQVQLTAIYGLRRLRDPRAAVLLQPIAADRRHALARDARRAIEAFGTKQPDSITLVRASQPDFIPPEELLRPASASTEDAPETLLRSSEKGG